MTYANHTNINFSFHVAVGLLVMSQVKYYPLMLQN
jgi:hypothetical protein